MPVATAATVMGSLTRVGAHCIPYYIHTHKQTHRISLYTRTGWLTLGPALTSSNFSREMYKTAFDVANGYLLQHSDEIEVLGKGNRGGGRGRGGREGL